MTYLARPASGCQPPRASVAPFAAPQHSPTTGQRRLLVRLPLPLAAVDPADRTALGGLLDAGRAWIVLDHTGKPVAARRWAP